MPTIYPGYFRYFSTIIKKSRINQPFLHLCCTLYVHELNLFPQFHILDYVSDEML